MICCSSLSRIMMPGLLLGTVLSVFTCWLRDSVILPSWLVSTDICTFSYNNNNNNHYHHHHHQCLEINIRTVILFPVRVRLRVVTSLARTCLFSNLGAEMAQSVLRLATGWNVRGSNPDGGEIFHTFQAGHGAHPASYMMATGSFLGQSGRGVTLTTHPS